MYLGIDIGTSGVKAVICDDAGSVIEQATSPLSVERPNPLWSEQDPQAWWGATQAAVKALTPENRYTVRGIGLSGQMHGATLLGPDDEILRPAILWNDGRSAAQCEALEAKVSDLAEITGNRAMPGFTAPKLVWLAEQQPEIFENVAKVLLPKDYVRLCMSGEYASDMSDSAGTLWLDTAKRDWSDKVLGACGLTLSHMPALYEGPEITGQLRAAVAADWGMTAVPIVAGGGDNAAGAIGSGVVKRGEGFMSLGTSGVIFLADDSYRPNAEGGVHTFCHAVPDMWHQMSVMLSAASAVDWVAKVCGFASPGHLYDLAESNGVRDIQEIFLPYLSGERTPHNDALAQGVLFGLGHNSSKASLAQAALEGVAFGMADGVAALKGSGAEIETLSVIGGGAQSAFWGRILASAIDIPLIYRDSGTVGPAYGAARLAQIGVTGADVASICTAPPVTHIAEPDPELRGRYQARLPLYRSLYKNLAASFKENSA